MKWWVHAIQKIWSKHSNFISSTRADVTVKKSNQCIQISDTLLLMQIWQITIKHATWHSIQYLLPYFPAQFSHSSPANFEIIPNSPQPNFFPQRRKLSFASTFHWNDFKKKKKVTYLQQNCAFVRHSVNKGEETTEHPHKLMILDGQLTNVHHLLIIPVVGCPHPTHLHATGHHPNFLLISNKLSADPPTKTPEKTAVTHRWQLGTGSAPVPLPRTNRNWLDVNARFSGKLTKNKTPVCGHLHSPTAKQRQVRVKTFGHAQKSFLFFSGLGNKMSKHWRKLGENFLTKKTWLFVGMMIWVGIWGTNKLLGPSQDKNERWDRIELICMGKESKELDRPVVSVGDFLTIA